MSAYEWSDCVAISRGFQQETEIATIQPLLVGCISVVRADHETDKSGTDYIATLRGGRTVAIDAKYRSAGASRYWKNGEPELALEKWSVMPGGRNRPKTGWTLSETSTTELILFTFHSSDTNSVFLFPFQHLRMAFRENINRWFETYKTDIQTTYDRGNSWCSQCVFVPHTVVWNAMQVISRGQLTEPVAEREPEPSLFADDWF